MPAPRSTYRLQLTPSFGLSQAADVVPYLADLGVSHVYCSPWLTSTKGSQHGYDVVDHRRVDPELGGEDGLQALVASCRAHGLGIVLDVVPNHMSVAAPESQNEAWWSVLRDGPSSPYASWFDIDWTAGPLLLAILGGPLADSLDDLAVDEEAGVLRYFEHELPLAPGSVVPGDLVTTLANQQYRLADWQVGTEEGTHRRFFDVSTLVGLRVEDPDVFDATHQLVLAQVRDGLVDGLRIDHPDGLADPTGYLRRLRAAAPSTWVVVEKVLEPGEELPGDWACDGTTGYEALRLVTGLFVDPAAQQPLTSLWEQLTGDHRTWAAVAAEGKRDVMSHVLGAEVSRLVDLAKPLCDERLLDVTRVGLHEACVELLVQLDVYRAYTDTERQRQSARTQLEVVAKRACAECPSREREIQVLAGLVLEGELATRFAQTSGPVMAKGVEDTALYRYAPLLALNEVGSTPERWGVSVEDWHQACTQQERSWPAGMTTLTTHDTKRSEDVRARLLAVGLTPQRWGEAVTQWTAQLPRRIDSATELLLWQTFVGAWPLTPDRARAYALKAVREAKTGTSWLAPDAAYEADVADYVTAVLADAALTAGMQRFVEELAPAFRSVVLAQKLVQLTMPGVPDTYQGCELVDLSLVDPDNRRPVDWDRRRHLLAHPDASLDSEKQQLVAAVLRLRREHAFDGYEPLPAPEHELAYRRGRVEVVVPLRGGAVGESQGDLLPGLPVRLAVR